MHMLLGQPLLAKETPTRLFPVRLDPHFMELKEKDEETQITWPTSSCCRGFTVPLE